MRYFTICVLFFVVFALPFHVYAQQSDLVWSSLVGDPDKLNSPE